MTLPEFDAGVSPVFRFFKGLSGLEELLRRSCTQPKNLRNA